MMLPENLIRLKCLLTLLGLFLISTVYADHLKGGWIKYSYVSFDGVNITYNISFYQYSSCLEPEKVDPIVYLGVFDAGTNIEVGDPIQIYISGQKNEKKDDFGPCFQNPPNICYIVAEYDTTIHVPVNNSGYVLGIQRCCRIAGIANVPESNNYGLTYTVTIPGGANSNDNSPVFDFNDAVAICYGENFSIDLGAKDTIDHDSLVYSLRDGLTGGTRIQPIVYDPASPPYESIPYNSPYSGSQPLGANASIDKSTGILSGVAPEQTGTYVVAVWVDEYRKGVYISHTRKEIHLDVANCKLGGASLKPSYITCNGFDFTFSNNIANSGFSYLWDFGVTGIQSDTSTAEHPTYKYSDTGDYIIKLKVENASGCSDSATSHLKIYPGFTVDFSVDGSCIKNPYQFKDLTATKYGVVNSWQWMFGDGYTDTIQNPAHTFTDSGFKSITLVATNSKGCIDTATKQLDVALQPDIALKFHDTLICSIDTLQLQLQSLTAGATYSWLPAYNISNVSSPTPYVSPKQTTVYNVTINYKGCSAADSVKVNVIDKVDLSLPADTTICKTDTIILNPSTNALYFLWSPSEGLSSTTIKNPSASPLSNTRYSVVASVGKCLASSNQAISIVPYPAVHASSNVAICYGKTTQLNATIDGTYFAWSPTNSLLNANTLNPIAGPDTTTSYILTVTDTLGCPKPVFDTVIVTVIPKVAVFAGNDTIGVINQPLQLKATASAGSSYEWTPSTYLNNASVQNPIATFPGGLDTITYTVNAFTEEGCAGSDNIKIYLFETRPAIFIPSAFTPNSDGLNDILKPTIAGMQKFNYFNVYNRWGQLLYNTSQQGQGWDGNFDGKKQPSGTYVYTASAVDYTGKNYFIKGTFVLIR